MVNIDRRGASGSTLSTHRLPRPNLRYRIIEDAASNNESPKSRQAGVQSNHLYRLRASRKGKISLGSNGRRLTCQFARQQHLHLSTNLCALFSPATSRQDRSMARGKVSVGTRSISLAWKRSAPPSDLLLRRPGRSIRHDDTTCKP